MENGGWILSYLLLGTISPPILGRSPKGGKVDSTHSPPSKSSPYTKGHRHTKRYIGVTVEGL